MRDYSTELELLKSLTPEERRLLLHNQKLQSELDWLKSLVDSMTEDNELIKHLSDKARDCLWWYEKDGNEDHLRTAETYAEVIELIKQNRAKVSEVRKQRERVQWQRKRVNSLKKSDESNTASKQSSSP
jgi:hypothetical protein